MLYRLRREFQTRRFNAAINEVFSTPPMPVVESTLTIVSMVATYDIPMYLLGMKSFYRRIGHGRLIAILARDTPASARTTLQRHFPGIAFETLEELNTGTCQRGGTWERLVYILDRAANEYIVQVDCDTLAVADDLQEVAECIGRNIPFAMADNNNRIQTLRETAERVKRWPPNYIGVIAEQMFERYPNCDALRYVRGSSGFAGFASGGFPRTRIEEFHHIMEELIGQTRWREWGTEQCASNFAIANSPGAIVLPFPDYTSFHPGGPRSGVKFFHFIGSHRFDEGFFAARGREEIRRLMQGAQRLT